MSSSSVLRSHHGGRLEMLGEDIGLAEGALGAPRQPLLQTWRVERMTLIALQGDYLISSLSGQWIGLIDFDVALIEPFEANRTS